MSKLIKSKQLLENAKFSTEIAENGTITITADVVLKGENKRLVFTINWDGVNEDFWDSIDIGFNCYDVNVWIVEEIVTITLYPVIEGETINSVWRAIFAKEHKPKVEEKAEYIQAIGRGQRTQGLPTFGYGLTKREYFAIQAMQGFLANPSESEIPSTYVLEAIGLPKETKYSFNEHYIKYVSQIAVKYADALLTELSKS